MSSNKASKNAQNALKPLNQSSPFGTLTNKNGKSSYNPTYQPGQKDILSAAPTNEASLLTGALPTATNQYQHQVGNYLGNVNDLTADNVVNPQMYNAQYHLQADPLLSQYHTDTNSLNDELAAKNLTGGSYDALAHGNLNKNLGLNLGQAANYAVGSGLGATKDYLGLQGDATTAAGNQMASLGNLAGQYQDLSSSLQGQLMNPFQQYTQYQGTVNPLQQAQAGIYQQQAGGLGTSIGGAAGAGLALAAAPFTGGASLAYIPMAASLGSNLGGGLSGGTYSPMPVPGKMDISKQIAKGSKP